MTLTSKLAFGLVASSLTVGSVVYAQDTNILTGRSCQVDTTPDSHQSAGQSDQMGDRKEANIVCRLNNYVFGGGYVLETPQMRTALNKKGRRVVTEAYDTGKIGIVAGKENINLNGFDASVYGRMGLYETERLQDMFLQVHRMGGMDGMRMSPRSTDDKIYGGVAGRIDQSFTVFDNVRLNLGAYGTLGTDQTALGANAFVSYMINGDGFKAPIAGISGVPLPGNRGTGLFAGLQLTNMFYDVTTDRLGTRRNQATAIFGGQVEWGRISFAAGVNMPLTSEITGEKHKALPDYFGVARLAF